MNKLILVLFLVYSGNVFSGTSRLYHRLKLGSNIAEVFTKLNLYPLFGKNGYVTKTLKLNPIISKIGANYLPNGFLLRLPPLPIRESSDWVIENDMLIFSKIGVNRSKQQVTNITNNFYDSKPRDTNNDSNQSILVNIGSLSQRTSLLDINSRKADLKIDKSWTVGGNFLFEKKNTSLEMGVNYENRIYADGPTINWSDDTVKRLSYNVSIIENFNQKYLLGVSIGNSDLISFQSISLGTLKIIRESRLYAKIIAGWNFNFFIPIESRLDLSILESLDVQGARFGFGHELSLKLSTSQRISSEMDLVFLCEVGYQDDAPANFKQSSTFVYLGLGFRWGGKNK